MRLACLVFLILAGCTAAKDSPEITLERGRIHSERGEFAEAIPFYTQSLQDFPERAEVAYLRGVAYENLNLLERALEDYLKCVELDPGHAEAINNCGVVLARLKRYDEAVEQFSKIISEIPDDVLALRNRGLCYHDLGQMQQSLEDYSKALEYAPDDAQAWFQRGNIYLDTKDYAAAEADFTKAIEVDESMARAWMNRGLARLRQGRRDDAKLDLSKGQELDENIILPGLDLLEQSQSVVVDASWSMFINAVEAELKKAGYENAQQIMANPALGFVMYRGMRDGASVVILAGQALSSEGDSQTPGILVPQEFLDDSTADGGTPRSRTVMIMNQLGTEEPSWSVQKIFSDWQPNANKIRPHILRMTL